VTVAAMRGQWNDQGGGPLASALKERRYKHIPDIL